MADYLTTIVQTPSGAVRYDFLVSDDIGTGRTRFRVSRCAEGKHPVSLNFRLNADDCKQLAAMFAEAARRLRGCE
jgi:hypothetical protein